MPERFYCPEAASSGRLVLEGDEARHLARVRRVAPGETVEVFDGRGFATRAEVRSVAKDGVELQPVGTPLPDRSAPLTLTLATAVPKGDRFDWLVEKATELGVGRLIPILSERSVVDPRATKLERLRRVVVEASKQCGRNRLMTIEAPVSFANLLAIAGDDLKLIAHPTGHTHDDWPAPEGRACLLAIGPEGGFTKSEVGQARESGWFVLGLGATLLRVETAGLVGCARLMALAESTRGMEVG
jgi:16S rRNA (uracil1498-N3)-methyltransferase